MAITTIPSHFVPSPTYMNALGAPVLAATGAINASGDRVAFVVRVPKTGTLDWFEFRTATVSNNPDNGLRLSFQDVDMSNGNADGVQDQFFDYNPGSFSSNTWITPSQVLTNDGTSGGTKRSVTAGQYLACVIDFASFTASDSLGFSLVTSNTSVYDGSQDMYHLDGSAGTYTRGGNQPIMALKYSDGTYGEFPTLAMGPFLTFNTRTFNSGSTPDERALRFQVPVSMRVKGFWVRLDPDAAVDVILYDNADNVLGSNSYDPDVRVQTNGAPFFGYFAPVTLTANTTYRLSVKPTSGSNISIYDFDVTANSRLGAVPGGIEWYSSTRTDAGSWSDTTTNRPYMGLLFDGVDVSAGGGSGGSFAFLG